MINGTYRFKLTNKKTGETKEYTKSNIITAFGIQFLFGSLFRSNNAPIGTGPIGYPPFGEPIFMPEIPTFDGIRFSGISIPVGPTMHNIGQSFIEKMFFITDSRELQDDDLDTSGLLSTNMKFVKDVTNFEGPIDTSQPGIFTKTYSGILFSGDLTISAVAGASGSAITTYTKLDVPVVKSSDEILTISYSLEYTHPWIELQERSGTLKFNETDYMYNIVTDSEYQSGDILKIIGDIQTNSALLSSLNPSLNHQDSYWGDVNITDTGIEIIAKHIIWITQENKAELEYQLQSDTFFISAINKVVLDNPLTVPEIIEEPIKLELPGTKYTFNFSNFNRRLFESIIASNNQPILPSGPIYPGFTGLQ